MLQLLFATHNQNKVKEIKPLLPNTLQVLSLTEANILEEIPEPFDTIEQNSETKAQYIYNTFHKNCFSEDTGLIVPSLNGEPGVKSARYAGDAATSQQNTEKLLAKLVGQTNTPAHFKTVITLVLNGVQHQFTGICQGHIIAQPIGDKGFGYDPIFVPQGSTITFAQMEMTEKNMFSHRKKALSLLLEFLQQEK
jgi:XTP/dITP diphosphohydrolase